MSVAEIYKIFCQGTLFQVKIRCMDDPYRCLDIEVARNDDLNKEGMVHLFREFSGDVFMLRTKTIYEITLSLNHSLAAATSSILIFSEALYPFKTLSKSLFLSVGR